MVGIFTTPRMSTGAGRPRRKPVKKRRGRIPKVVKADEVSDEDFLLLESFLTELLQKPEFSIQVILLIIKM